MPWFPQCVCPECRRALVEEEGRRRCVSCGLEFPLHDGVVHFLAEDRFRRVEPFLSQYRRVRRADGHVVPDARAYRELPFRPPTAASTAEWAIRAQSLRTLAQSACLRGAPKRVLDVGAGNGWLSQRLAAAGHLPVAVDVNDDGEDGLRAARRGLHDVPLVQADFDALPFAPAQFDVVVLNASLHYAPDVWRTIEGASRLLLPGGALVVMDSPWFERDVDGEAMVQAQQADLARRYRLDAVVRPGLGYLTFKRLQDVAVRLGRDACFTRSQGPLPWRLTQMRRRWRAVRPPAMFGVWMTR